MNMSTHAEIRTLATASAAAETLADPRWPAVQSRSRAADGQFVYSVKTTGVYCRPSCGARLARPENVAFHRTNAEAEVAGFRPCKRCKPAQACSTEQQATLIADLCRHIEAAARAGEVIPGLQALASRAGLSSSHLHRLFKATTGVTPKAYAAAQRGQRMRQALQHGASVTDAIYDAGFSSASRFYEKADQMLGMTASDFRSGGADTGIAYAVALCRLGLVLVARSDRGICAITLGDDADGLVQDLQSRFPKAQLSAAGADFGQWVAQVVAFVEAPGFGLALPLDVRGSAFQQRVWQALQSIPAGSTLSYSQVAQRIGAPRAARAVAQACAANALAVAIPCHRVLGANGQLAGYRWGVERKRALLASEAAK